MTDEFFLQQDEENISSIIGLEVAFADEVEFVDVYESNNTFGNVNFALNADFRVIYVTPGKTKVSISPKTKDGNTIYDVKLVALHPKDRVDAAEILFNTSRHNVLAKYKTGNGVVKLIGTHLEHAQITIEPVNESSGYDGYEITIEGEFTLPPLIEA